MHQRPSSPDADRLTTPTTPRHRAGPARRALAFWRALLVRADDAAGPGSPAQPLCRQRRRCTGREGHRAWLTMAVARRRRLPRDPRHPVAADRGPSAGPGARVRGNGAGGRGGGRRGRRGDRHRAGRRQGRRAGGPAPYRRAAEGPVTWRQAGCLTPPRRFPARRTSPRVAVHQPDRLHLAAASARLRLSRGGGRRHGWARRERSGGRPQGPARPSTRARPRSRGTPLRGTPSWSWCGRSRAR